LEYIFSPYIEKGFYLWINRLTFSYDAASRENLAVISKPQVTHLEQKDPKFYLTSVYRVRKNFDLFPSKI